MSLAWSMALCWASVCVWFALRVWWVRESWVSWVERVDRCWDRKVCRVLRESEIRVREAVSLEILKWDVHWDMSCWGLVGGLHVCDVVLWWMR
jgi:hypothetical protein